MQGVWGNFVSSWYPIFYSGDIVKLGRLEYEDIPYPWETPYKKHGLVVKKGDPVKNIHIPSSGEPFDLPARLDSYKRAYGFFREELQGGPLVCVCHSWLLYPQNRQVLSPSSNIVSFQEDFDLVGWEETGDLRRRLASLWGGEPGTSGEPAGGHLYAAGLQTLAAGRTQDRRGPGRAGF